MGAWGCHSFSNDSCCDILDRVMPEDVSHDKITQKQLDKCIDRLWTSSPSWADEEEYMGLKLGVVVFGLCRGHKVSLIILRSVLLMVNTLQMTKYVQNWSEPRKEFLDTERTLIFEAIERNGKALKKTIKRVYDEMTEEGNPKKKKSNVKDILGNSIFEGSQVLWFKCNSKEPPAIKGKVTKIEVKKRGTVTIKTVTVDLKYRTTKVNNTDRLIVIDKLV